MKNFKEEIFERKNIWKKKYLKEGIFERKYIWKWRLFFMMKKWLKIIMIK